MSAGLGGIHPHGPEGTPMTIELSDEQYLALVKVLFLGTWMTTAFREEPIPEFQEAEQAFLSRAPAFKADDVIVYDVKKKQWFPTKAFEEEMLKFVDEYDIDSFYDELTYGLAHRDMENEIGEEKCNAMTKEEFAATEAPYLEKYYDEFDEYGIERLGVMAEARKRGGRSGG